jgi:UDP-glucose 4-epimerase
MASLLSGRKILVTGARGFIGSHLYPQLLELDAEVHGGSRYGRSDWSGRVHWWYGDLTDLRCTRTLLTAIRPDVIFHLAGHATGAPDLGVVAPTLRNNLVATVNVLTAAAELGCKRIILAGSCDEPDSADRIPSPYAASKVASSVYAKMFTTLYRTPVVTARVSFVYGPGQDAGKLIPYVIRTLLRGQEPRLTSGRLEADWIYMDDVIDALVRLAYMPNLEGQTIDIGSGTLASVRGIVERLVRAINPGLSPQFGAIPDRPLEQEITRSPNIQLTYELTGWRPSVPLSDGLNRTIDWYKRGLSLNHEISPEQVGWSLRNSPGSQH